MRVVCLASGRGSNFEALVKAEARGELSSAEIVALGVNRPDCGALHRARSHGVPDFVVDHRNYADKAGFEQALLQHLSGLAPDLIILAGFMRILTESFLEGVGVPVVNLHPALLPAFPGIRGTERAFEAGVRLSGCTTHVVIPAVDAGPILMQGLVPMHPGDALPDVQDRMQAMEHRLLPATVAALARGDLRWIGSDLLTAPQFQPFLLPAAL